MSTTAAVRVFSPASVSNVACGFDVLGFALDGPGDRITATRTATSGVQLGSIRGDEGRLPRDPRANTASVAAQALFDRLRPEGGIRLDIEKCMPTSSGLGSSAASAIGAVVAVDALLGAGLDRHQLLSFALAGECLASGDRHADNLAPSLYGGLVLVRSLDPEPDVVSLPVPAGLSCAVLRPHIEVETKAARRLLGSSVSLGDAVTQWGNLAGLVAALFRSDFDLLARSLRDVIAEPVRAPLVPGFRAVQEAAMRSGALGCSLSGSGPSIFALCPDAGRAETVGESMRRRLEEAASLAGDVYVSRLDVPGARVLSADGAAPTDTETPERGPTCAT